MILTVTIILSALVALNFLLLFISCNKTQKSAETTVRTPLVLSKLKTDKLTLKSNPTKQLTTSQLAPTGS